MQREFRAAYGAQRAAEGRALDDAALLQLPYLQHGPLARQWSVRARTFDVFVQRVLAPCARERGRPLTLLDLGAGNGWLSWRATRAGHRAIAIDLREDKVDGLGAADVYRVGTSTGFESIVGSFESLPLPDARFDVVVFNASLHYALDLDAVLAEARRVTRAGGRIAILDSPFYAREADGARMVAEKRRGASLQFGDRAPALLSLPFIEYLTRERLLASSRSLGLAWRKHRVRYPLWYELRPTLARLRGDRRPSRFDVWVGVAP